MQDSIKTFVYSVTQNKQYNIRLKRWTLKNHVISYLQHSIVYALLKGQQKAILCINVVILTTWKSTMFLFSSKLSLGNLYIIRITNINDPFYLTVKCHLFSITMTSYFVTIVIVKLAITKYHIHSTSYILR